MTVTVDNSRNQYIADSGQTLFPYTFEVISKSDLEVSKNSIVLTEGTDYTVTGVGINDGGVVTLTTGAQLNDVITIYRNMRLVRLNDYQQSGDFLAEQVNDDFDRIWLALQQIVQDSNNAIRSSISDSSLDSQNTILANVETRKNKTLGFDSDGKIIYSSVAIPIGDFKVYDNIETMKSDSNLAVNDVALCKKYYSGGDLVEGLLFEILESATVDGYIDHEISNGNFAKLFRNDIVSSEVSGAKADGVTDNTSNIQIILDSFIPDVGGIVLISPNTKFNLKNLDFPKRSTLQYYEQDDTSTVAGNNAATSELVTFHANANNAGIVNEKRETAPFHIGHILEIRKDITSHDDFLGNNQSRTNPVRVSYNMLDEGYDRYRTILEQYEERTPISGVTSHAWSQKITLSGVGENSFVVAPVEGDRFQGVTSGAVGLVYSISSNETVLLWYSGEFVSGENVVNNRGTVASPINETSSTVISNVSHVTVAGQPIGTNFTNTYWSVGLPPELAKEVWTVGGKSAVTRSRSFGQFGHVVIDDPSRVWVDSYELASPSGIELAYDTSKPSLSRRLVYRKYNESENKGMVGAVSASTGFSNSAIKATSSYNVSSVVRNGIGDYSINFETPMTRADYQVTFGKSNPQDNPYVFIKTTNDLRIRNVTNGTTTPADLLALIDVHVTCGDI